MSKFKKIWLTVKNIKLSKMLLSFQFSGYLIETGWVNSFNTETPVDAEGKPIPWVTIPFIDFISSRLTKNMNMFEFGCGNSTLYFANYVGEIKSVEHDISWYNKMSGKLPVNAALHHFSLERNGEYSNSVNTIDNSKYEIIFIDGRDRVNCVISSLNSLSENGVIILDDSERDEYTSALKKLESKGFKKLDFWGVSLCLFYKKCTSIFYRNSNVLNI